MWNPPGNLFTVVLLSFLCFLFYGRYSGCGAGAGGMSCLRSVVPVSFLLKRM